MKKSNNPGDNNSSFRYGFQMLFKENEKYYFQFNDTDGEPLLFSKGYSSEKSCANGIEAVLRAAGNEKHYDLQETKKGKYFFILKSGNYKEIGRSRMFDTLEELDEQMKLFKNLGEDVPQYCVTDTSSETKDEVPEEKEKEAESGGKELQVSKSADKPQAKSVEKMPRYKFSVIYYPDSKIWMIKNDFSGDSMKLKTYDGHQIEDFFTAQLPVGELEVGPPAVKPKESVKKEVPAQSKEPALEAVELKIRTQQGELIQKTAKKGNISTVEITPKVSGAVQPQAFEARVMAKSLEDNQNVIIGATQKQSLVDGRFVVSIYGANNLKAGLYIFTANIYQNKPGGQPLEYYGSQLIVLN